MQKTAVGGNSKLIFVANQEQHDILKIRGIESFSWKQENKNCDVKVQ